MGTTQYMGEYKSRVRKRRTAREQATESKGTIVSWYTIGYNNIRIRLCHGNTSRKIGWVDGSQTSFNLSKTLRKNSLLQTSSSWGLRRQGRTSARMVYKRNRWYCKWIVMKKQKKWIIYTGIKKNIQSISTMVSWRRISQGQGRLERPSIHGLSYVIKSVWLSIPE